MAVRDHLQKCYACGFQEVRSWPSFCPTCDVKMMSCEKWQDVHISEQLSADVHENDLVCLNCGHRSSGRHNTACPCCSTMMVFERAASKVFTNPDATGHDQVELELPDWLQPDNAGQLNLFGGAA